MPENFEAADDWDLEWVAERLFWWQTPQQALADSHRFVAQVMALGTDRDVAVVERRFGTEAFDAVLDQPPPGLFTPRRWNYWHVRQRRCKPRPRRSDSSHELVRAPTGRPPTEPACRSPGL